MQSCKGNAKEPPFSLNRLSAGGSLPRVDDSGELTTQIKKSPLPGMMYK